MLDGLHFLPGYLDAAAQAALVSDVQALLREAPPYRALMPKSGQPMRVRMSNAGALGWYTDRDGGYRYIAAHPETGRPWPVIPESILGIWRGVSGYTAEPECCLINLYDAAARMGLHQDRDEQDFAAPVVSISLGDSALFRVGGQNRRDPTRSLKLASGDVLVLGGEARLAFHGIDRIHAGSSRLLAPYEEMAWGRINLTLRRVTLPR
ncbi:alpha-ketoglutarate-dependent dioxygenase AlkB family protein [Ferrovibrio sp.]|uniref:alpha-ketoglutarate-dependent dioxygenase AlkB family protein n=1 Tax=Ferrovibrio sp. TaxID=1917215 RepID=UPI003D0C3968